MKMKTDKFQWVKRALAAVLFLSFLVVLLPPLGAYASETTITEDDMKKKWDEFAAGVAEGWEKWEYLEDYELEKLLPRLGMSATFINGGDGEYLTKITMEDLQEFDDLDAFLFNRYGDVVHVLLGSKTIYKNKDIEDIMGRYVGNSFNIYTSDVGPGEHPDLKQLNDLVKNYSEYAIAFWEQTGLVYSPYEDIFYVQAGVPYEEGQAAGTLAPTPPPNDGEGPAIDESVFEGMTAEERRELEQDIEDFWADDGGQNGGQGGGTNGLVIGGIALAAVAVVAAVVIALSRKKRGFMSDPK
jgi:hypothetical protein